MKFIKDRDEKAEQVDKRTERQLKERIEAASTKEDQLYSHFTEGLLLIKKICSNQRVIGANVEFDLKKPFQKIVELKNLEDNER